MKSIRLCVALGFVSSGVISALVPRLKQNDALPTADRLRKVSTSDWLVLYWGASIS